MANPKIEVEIGAVIDGLRKGFGESVKIIETLEKQALDLDKALKAATDLPTIQGLNAQLAQTKAALSQLKNSGIDPLTKATSNYNSVGIDFARIVQDAPFGIIGVGNNIQQLAGSFQSLKNSTGSTSAALKQAFASIFSSGNALVLGISVLTSVLTVLQQKGFFKTEESAKSLSDTLEKYRETLDAVTKTSIEGQANSAKEIQSFTLLRAQAENTNISLQNRREAVAQLQKQYPEYLKGLSEEQILTGQVGNAYNELTKGLIATAKARAASDQIAKNSLDTLTILAQEEDRALKILQERDKLESIVANKGKATGQDLLALKNQESIQNQKINALIREQLDSAEQRNKIETENSNLTSQINLQLSQGAVFTKEKTEQVKSTNKEKEKELKLEDQNIVNLEFANQLRNEALQKLGQISSNVDRLTAKKVSIELDGTPIDGILAGLNSILVNTPSVVAALENIGKVKVDLSTFIPTDIKPDEVKKSFSPLFEIVDELTSSFGGLGSIIGSVFGNNQKLGQFIAQFVGFAAKLIAANFKIASSNAIAGASQAAAATGPAAPITLPAFIAGSLAVVAGAFAAFGGGGRKSSSVGSSGVGAGSSFVGGGAQGGLFAQNNNLTGEFVVRGTDLVYVLGQANNKINKG
jgi:hypothetical protein